MQFQVSHQAQVDHIVSEITNKTVNNLAYNNYDTSNRDDQTTLKNKLRDENPALTEQDLGHLAFVGETTIAETKSTPTQVAMQAKIGNASADFNIGFQVSNAAQTEQVVKDIQDVDINLPYGTTYSTANDKGTLINYIEKANPQLKGDLDRLGDSLAFANDTAIKQEDQNETSVNLEVNVGSSTQTITVNFKVDNTWTQIPNIPATAEINYPPAKINDVDYVGTYGDGLWRSTDGLTWTKVNADATVGNIPADAELYDAPVEINNMLYAATYGQGLWTSTNGTTWNRADAVGIPTTAKLPSPVQKLGNAYYVSSNGSGLYRSTDGINWTQVNASATPGNLPNNSAILAPPVKLGATYYVGTDGNGLWSSTDGLNWSRALGIVNNAAFDHPPTEFNGTYYVGANNAGLWRI